MSRYVLFTLLVLCCVRLGSAGEPPEGLFPFVLPWDDDTPGITNLSHWLDAPAGKHGPVHADADGHLWVGQQRIRFFGTDLSHSANFPLKPDAEKIARRLARFGINIVRFHILDIDHFPRALLLREAASTRQLDPEALDRLDYFIGQLKANGIYVDLNLLNYRPFNAADGLPKEIEQFSRPHQLRHIAGFLGDETHLDLQREYARQLLGHRNPYTKLAYADDPAVAFVEINNENGLLHAWIKGRVDEQPEVFLAPFRQRWNDWLHQRYGNTAKLRAVWSVGTQPLTQDELLNPLAGLDAWQLQSRNGAVVTIALGEELPETLRVKNTTAKSLRVQIDKLPGDQPKTVPWRVLLNRRGLSIDKDRAYTLSFWAKADNQRRLPLRLSQVDKPWHTLSATANADLTEDWQPFDYVLVANADASQAKLLIGDLGNSVGTIWLAGLSLRPGGIGGLRAGEQVENATVDLLSRHDYDRRSSAVQADWLAFLWDCENAYWQGIQRYLKDDLKVRGLVIGTASQYSTPNLMAGLDCVDAHAYWQHPRFPHRMWDGKDWFVRNLSMADAAGGLLPPLALRRVLGKPFATTEYGSPSPNTHSGEGPLLVGAYAALQDWDFISISRYTRQTDDQYTWGSGHFRGYFDVDQHPTKMLGFIPAIAMFRREDVQPARQQVVVPLDPEEEMAAINRRDVPWCVLDPTTLGVPPETALVHRVAIATEGRAIPPNAIPPDPELAEQPRWLSDTDELVWDHAASRKGVVTVNTARSKAVIGYGGGRRFDLGGVVIEPGPSLQDGWSTITLTAMTGDLAHAPAHLLVTATGYVENTGMGWKDAAKSTVGRDWGTAPTLVEGIRAKITLPFPAATVAAWALDERGQRREQLALETADATHTVLRIGPERQTLWYEVEVRH